jgi:hypothetical protein
MTKFLANWEVESELILPAESPFIRYDHPASTYTVFLRNIPPRNDVSFLSMQLVFDAPLLHEAKPIATTLAKEFLDYLCFVSNIKIRLRTLLHILNWEPGAGMREALYFAPGDPYDDAPYEILEKTLLDSVSLLQTHTAPPRLRRALKWFASGVAVAFPDDQFAYFWFVIELIAQLIKEPAPVPDKCPSCHGPLYCETCNATPLHRPYPKQAIEQLFTKYGPPDDGDLHKRATRARNMLMHGDEVQAIESELQIEFPDLVDKMGYLARISILNQFVPVLVGKTPNFLQTNVYVYKRLGAAVHVQIGFLPNFANPDPGHFPNLNITSTRTPRFPAPQPGVLNPPGPPTGI